MLILNQQGAITKNLSVNEQGVKHLIDLKSKENMHLYYGLKNRFEYHVENREEVISQIAQNLLNYVKEYDFIVYPQSSSDFLKKVVFQLGKTSVEIKKSSMQEVMVFMQNLPLQKKERQSHLERLEQMGESLKINQFKASQRVKYEKVLFKKTNLPTGKGLIVDDSSFSGTTYRALKEVASSCDYVAIFAK